MILVPRRHQTAMVSNLTGPVLAMLCCCVALSLAHPLTVPRVVRLIPPSNRSGGGLEKRFRAIRQSSQDDMLPIKILPRCKQRAVDRGLEIDDACLSCATNVDTGQVSECPEGCCRTLNITEDLETAHFITCYKGCCVRSVGVLSESSDRDAGDLVFEQVFAVNNDITLNEITSLGQCMVQDGSSKGCGSSCALFTPTNTTCSNANSFRVPAFGENFVDPPCTEAEDSSGSKEPGDGSGSSSTDIAAGDGNEDDENGDNMNGDDAVGDGDDNGDRDVDNGNDEDNDVTGPAKDEDMEDDADEPESTGPTTGAGITGDDDEDLEPSVAEEVEESSPEGLGESTQESVGNTEGIAGQGAGDASDTDDAVCFPAGATVELVNGRKKRMEDLRTDDIVLVGAGKYSRVFGFTHEKKDYHGRFVELHMNSGHILRLTAGHYMYTDGVMRKAREVHIGHTVKLGNGGSSEVTDIHEWTGHGLFNPQTVDGDIVVDGVVVSTYTEAVDARLAHALLTPVRAISKWVDVSVMLSRMATGLRGARKLMAKTTS